MEKKPVTPKVDSGEDEIDGCGCEVSLADATPDEDLPAAEGGIAK